MFEAMAGDSTDTKKMTNSEKEAQVKFIEKQTLKLQKKADEGKLTKDDADDMVTALFNTKKVTKYDTTTTTTTTTTDANGKVTTSTETTVTTTTVTTTVSPAA